MVRGVLDARLMFTSPNCGELVVDGLQMYWTTHTIYTPHYMPASTHSTMCIELQNLHAV